MNMAGSHKKMLTASKVGGRITPMEINSKTKGAMLAEDNSSQGSSGRPLYPHEQSHNFLTQVR